MADDKNPAQDSDELQQEGVNENDAAAQAEAEAELPAEAVDDDADQDAEAGETPAGDLAEEVAALKDQVLRATAEMENVRRRAQRDVEAAHKFAVEKLIDGLFPVLDSLEKAVETAAGTDGAQAIAEGVELSLKLFNDTLAKSGVEQIDPLGEPFDPQLHEAMTMVPNPDAEPNSVMDVMQKGYVLNGRLVRAAKVIVVKGEDASSG